MRRREKGSKKAKFIDKVSIQGESLEVDSTASVNKDEWHHWRSLH